jgi:hypothetical protein
MQSDRVVPFNIGFVPEAGVSGPTLLQSDHSTYLLFNAMREVSGGGREEAGTGLVELVRCIATKFGYPNDEALPGHPLYKQGLSYYGVYEVRGSSWIKQMEEQNCVSFPKFRGWGIRHFIFTFHDSTLECAVDSLKPSASKEPYRDVLARVVSQLR